MREMVRLATGLCPGQTHESGKCNAEPANVLALSTQPATPGTSVQALAARCGSDKHLTADGTHIAASQCAKPLQGPIQLNSGSLPPDGALAFVSSSLMLSQCESYVCIYIYIYIYIYRYTHVCIHTDRDREREREIEKICCFIRALRAELADSDTP